MADVVLISHFCVVFYVTFGLLILPIGYMFNWIWTRHRKMRLIHASFVGFITLEAVLGIACPLTQIEIYLRNIDFSQSFVSYWITELIYWDLPKAFFIILYLSCSSWSLLFWVIHPPMKTSGNMRAWIKIRWHPIF